MLIESGSCDCLELLLQGYRPLSVLRRRTQWCGTRQIIGKSILTALACFAIEYTVPAEQRAIICDRCLAMEIAIAARTTRWCQKLLTNHTSRQLGCRILYHFGYVMHENAVLPCGDRPITPALRVVLRVTYFPVAHSRCCSLSRPITTSVISFAGATCTLPTSSHIPPEAQHCGTGTESATTPLLF